MPPDDDASRITDAHLAALERRIAETYREARDSLSETVRAYFERFRERDAEMKKLIGSKIRGRIWTESDYRLWRLNQIARGKNFEELRDVMAERYTNAHEIALAYLNADAPEIYALNYNRELWRMDTLTNGAVTIDQSTDADGAVSGHVRAGFGLLDEREQTLKRLISKQPDIMPYYPKAKAVARGIDLDYGKSQITKVVTSAILQGKSIPHIADDLQERIETMSRVSAIRAARTGYTEAQNGGRQAAAEAAAKIGVKSRKRWACLKDHRTRHAHQKADGQIVDGDVAFDVGGEKLMFPGDKSLGASAWNLYNCRCQYLSDEGDFRSRKIAVQTPEYTRAILAEKRGEKRLERARKREQEAQDPDERKELRRKRLAIEKEVRELSKTRRGTEKYIDVQHMTYKQWEEWVSSGKSYSEWKAGEK